MHVERLFEESDEDDDEYSVLSEAALKILEKYSSTAFDTDGYEDGGIVSVSFSLTSEQTYCGFNLSQLPFNCGCIILGHFNSNGRNVRNLTQADIEKNRQVDLSTAVELCKLMGYTKVLTTVNSSGYLKQFLDGGWTELKELSFNNKRTRNQIYWLEFNIE
jgi:hypothetical protein